MLREIVLENQLCRLRVGSDCIVKSLVIKANGEEVLRQDEEIALFSVTQERPYNNEVKLAHPNKRTTFQANALRREGNKLIVGFEIVPYEAVVQITEADSYIAFELVDFLFTPESYGLLTPTSYGDLKMTPPPVAEFRLVQLPVKNRCNFGEWLNVSWDQTAAVGVLSTSPYEVIDSERRKGYRIMSADAVKGIKLRGCSAAIIAVPSGQLLDAIEALEVDYDLPLGVKSRRDYPTINASICWTRSINPQTVEEHIAYAKQGGFRMMLIHYAAIVEEAQGFGLCGNYDYLPAYPEGKKDLERMLKRIKEAGITPGIHFLHTHIGMWSRYITPEVDHRINLTRHFTLARPLSMEDTTIYVEQNPEDTVMHPMCRYLCFGGELIHYETYTTVPPYCFVGCKRGAYDTYVKEHPAGLVGGILDISEFGATSAYIDQNSGLQDEIAEKIADLYNAGFEFVYFDGSEGTNIPHGIHVSKAQYRVLQKFKSKPLFTEGAARSHFGWHYLSGGNAFDVFRPEIFKSSIDQYPAEEASRMIQDFTRLNFGWWGYFLPGSEDGGLTGTQPDMYEYGSSRAAAWDCPATMLMYLDRLKEHPRTDDILEVMRRWEDVRQKKWLTREQKLLLRQKGQEHILLINEQGEYELQPYRPIACKDVNIRAFVFQRSEANYVVFWHLSGSGRIRLTLDGNTIELKKEIGGEAISHETMGDQVVLPIGGRCYLKTMIDREKLVKAFEQSELI